MDHSTLNIILDQGSFLTYTVLIDFYKIVKHVRHHPHVKGEQTYSQNCEMTFYQWGGSKSENKIEEALKGDFKARTLVSWDYFHSN